MPRIPLFNQGAQPASRAARIRTPMAPTTPVRVAMGTIDKETIANFSSEPEADPRPWLREGAATARFGEAIQEAGQVLNKLALAKAETINRLDLAEGEAALDRTYADFEQWKQQTNADPREWGAEWERRSADLEKRAITDRMSPVVKDRMTEAITRFRARSAILVETDATKKLFQLDGDRIRAGYLRAVDEGDLPRATGLVEEGVGLGLLPEDEGVRMSINAREQVKAKKKEEVLDTVTGLIESSPEGAELFLRSDEEILAEFPAWETLDNGEKARTARYAETRQNSAKSKALDTIIQEAAEGRILSRNALDMMVEDGRLLPTDRDKYLAYVEARNPVPDDPDRIMQVVEAIDNYNAAEDPLGNKIVGLKHSMLRFSQERTKWFQERMKRREEEALGLVPTHPHAGTARQGIYQALSRGFFGPLTKIVRVQEPVLNDKGEIIKDAGEWKLKDVYDQEKIREAKIQQAKALDTLDKWLANPANANKSRAEVEAFAQSLLPKAPGLSTGAGSILGEDDEDPEGSLNSLLDNPLFSE
jgi:hypothetical protein